MDNDKIEKLKQLSELYKEGILTKEELETEKKKILEDRILYKEKRDENLFSPQTSGKETHWKQDNFINVSSKNNPNRKLVPNKKRLIYLIATIIILIGIGVFIGLYQHHQNVVAQQREQEMLDSIAEVERLLEIQRQDSIAEVMRVLEQQRLDSINFEKVFFSEIFNSIFKKIKVDIDDSWLSEYCRHETTYTFREKDNIIDRLSNLKFVKEKVTNIEMEAPYTDGSDTSVSGEKIDYTKFGTTISLYCYRDDVLISPKLDYIEIYFPSISKKHKFIGDLRSIGFKPYSGYDTDAYRYGECTFAMVRDEGSYLMLYVGITYGP